MKWAECFLYVWNWRVSENRLPGTSPLIQFHWWDNYDFSISPGRGDPFHRALPQTLHCFLLRRCKWVYIQISFRVGAFFVFFLWAVGCCQIRQTETPVVVMYEMGNYLLMFSLTSDNFDACSRSDGEAVRRGRRVAGWYRSSWLICSEVDSGQWLGNSWFLISTLLKYFKKNLSDLIRHT